MNFGDAAQADDVVSGSDPGSWERAYRDHRRAVYGYAVSLAGRSVEADDLVHEAFVRLVRRDPKLDRDATRAWLVRCVRHRFIDSLRRRTGATRLDVDFAVERRTGRAADAPSQDIVGREVAADVHRELQRLDRQDAEVIRLRVFAGLGFASIGEILDMPAATARTRYRRALKVLERRLVRMVEP